MRLSIKPTMIMIIIQLAILAAGLVAAGACSSSSGTGSDAKSDLSPDVAGADVSPTTEASVDATADAGEPDLPDPGSPWVVVKEGFINDVATDDQGSVYVTGSFFRPLTLGKTTLQPAATNSHDIFVAKLSRHGDPLWAVSAGGTSDFEWGNSIAVSGDSVLVTGRFNDEATFGQTTLTQADGPGTFVARLSADDGAFVWAITPAGGGFDEGEAIAVDQQQSAYVTGHFQGACTFGDDTLTSKGAMDVFVAKISADGGFVWARSAGGPGLSGDVGDQGLGIAVGPQAEVYVTGEFFGDQASFGEQVLSAGELSAGDSAYASGAFISKMSPADGAFVWTVTGTTNQGVASGYDLALGPGGDVYATGTCHGSIQLARAGAAPSTPSSAIPCDQGYVARISADGDVDWVQSPVGGNAVAVDAQGDVWLTGDFFDTVTLGEATLQTAEQSDADIFVARLSSSGEPLWATSVPGSGAAGGPEQGNGIAVDPSGGIVAAGTVEKASFDGTIRGADHAFNFFVWRIVSGAI